jgi:hypothetical protein
MMIVLLKKHGWLAIPLAIAVFGAAAAVNPSGHEHGGTSPISAEHGH